MRVAGVAGDENAGRTGRPVIEDIADALADFIGRPPGDLFHVQPVGREDASRFRNQHLGRDLAVGGPLIPMKRVELDIEADHIAALARNDKYAAVIRRLDRRLQPDIGEIGDGQYIHHAPKLPCGFAFQIDAQRPSDRAARAVAADDIAGADCFGLTISAAERRCYGKFRVGGSGQRDKLPVVFRRQAPRRLLHFLKIEIMHPRLIEDEMRHLGQVILDILYAVDAGQPPGAFRRAPEGDFIDLIGFPHDFFREAERLEHLNRSAGDAVGLPDLKRAGLALDDAGVDVGKGGKLRGQRQARRTAADDEDVGGVPFLRRVVRRLSDGGVAAAIAVEVVLHLTPSRLCHSAPTLARIRGRGEHRTGVG